MRPHTGRICERNALPTLNRIRCLIRRSPYAKPRPRLRCSGASKGREGRARSGAESRDSNFCNRTRSGRCDGGSLSFAFFAQGVRFTQSAEPVRHSGVGHNSYSMALLCKTAFRRQRLYNAAFRRPTSFVRPGREFKRVRAIARQRRCRVASSLRSSAPAQPALAAIRSRKWGVQHDS